MFCGLFQLLAGLPENVGTQVFRNSEVSQPNVLIDNCIYIYTDQYIDIYIYINDIGISILKSFALCIGFHVYFITYIFDWCWRTPKTGLRNPSEPFGKPI